jgi:ribonucleoside-diphosphate reductase alpha chain
MTDYEYDESETMFVITRTGKKEPLNTDFITKRLQSLVNKQPKIPHINCHQLMLSVCKGLKNNITTYEIDEYSANVCASLSINNPYYLQLAGRIAIDNHQKITMRSFIDKMRKAYLYKEGPLLNAEFFKYVEEHQDHIEKLIDYNRDFYLDFFGIRTFQRQFSIKIEDDPIERPQDMFMRTAIALNLHTCKDIKEELDNIKETYDLLSEKYYTHASPTYYNAGGLNPQYASCFLLGTEDSLEGIEKTGADMSRISKWAGGIGVHVNSWRGTGARIKGTNGKSSGIVPFLRTYETRMLAFNQGGRRAGSAKVYLMPHHPDTIKFIQLRRNNGSEKERARDLFYAMWIPDIFMKRVEDDALWSFFDPNTCGDLSELHGDAYTAKYLELEEKKLYTSQLPARTIWKELYESNKETGMPDILFSDTANKHFMQSNLGTLKSSNLCVTGSTMILTDRGYYSIKSLVEEGSNYTVWNGDEFSEAYFEKTGTDQSLYLVKFSDGVSLKCTPYHKFLLSDNTVLNAKDLRPKQELYPYTFPIIYSGEEAEYDQYSHGFYCGSESSYLHIYRGTFRKAISIRKKDREFISHLDHTDLRPHGTYVMVILKDNIPKKDVVPINNSFNDKLRWLSGYLDGLALSLTNRKKSYIDDEGCVNIINTKPFILDFKYLLNTMGINVDINENQLKLNPHAMNSLIIKKISPIIFDYDKTLLAHNMKNYKLKPVHVTCVEELSDTEDTYCFNEPKRNTGIFNGVMTKNCNEIFQYSSSKEYAVCILSSIALPKFVLDSYSEEELKQPEEKRRPLDHDFPTRPQFDYQKLVDVTNVVCRNLNNLIDKTYHPVNEAKSGCMRQRAIGIGVQGLDDAFAKMRFPFDSPEANDLNAKIFETIYYGSLSCSTKLCRKFWLDAKAECKEKGTFTIDVHNFKDYSVSKQEYKDIESIPKTIGAYPGYHWNGGSHISKGIFHWELCGLTKDKLSGIFDWETLREHIKQFGVRNSLLVALMPTASTSQLLGNNECFEPYTSNVYKRDTSAGEFIVIKKHLIHDLNRLGIWNKEIVDYIKASEGSIQYIDGIPDDIKKLYKTVWEIDQIKLIEQAATRQPFVDQGQSMNLYVKDFTYKKWHDLMFTAWELGLKTGKYYLHSRPAAMPIKFTIDPKKQREMEELMKKIKKDGYDKAFMKPLHEICGVCSS